MTLGDASGSMQAARSILMSAGEAVVGDTHGAAIGLDGDVRNGAMAWSQSRVVLVFYGSPAGDYVEIAPWNLGRYHKPPLAPNAMISTAPESFLRHVVGIADLVGPKARMKALAAAMGVR